MSDRDDQSDHDEHSVAGSSSSAEDDPSAWFDSGDVISSPEAPAVSESPQEWIGEVDFLEAPDADELRATPAGWRRWAPVGLIVVGVVAVVGLGAGVLAGGDDPPAAETALVPEPKQLPSAPSASVGECASDEDGVTVSDGEGSSDSVAGVVVAFNHGYYTERSAEAALEAADSERFDADALQAGIDTVPEGTTHCVRVEVDGATAAVELTESRPGGVEQVYEQVVETSEDDGQVSITQIRDAESEGDDSDDDET